jgi:hypothetical protein
MRRTVSAFLAVCSAITAMAQNPVEDTEAGTISGNQFQSVFFKFRYDFPKGWTYLSRDKTKAENAEASRKAAEKSLKENGPDDKVVSGNTTTTRTTKLYANFNLLIASATAINTSETDSAPRVRVWAHERVPGLLNDAGDHAKIIAMLGEKIFMPATEITLNGHKFVRIDVLHKDGLYHSDVETVCGGYIVGFDFYARTAEELRALAETLNTVRFD